MFDSLVLQTETEVNVVLLSLIYTNNTCHSASFPFSKKEQLLIQLFKNSITPFECLMWALTSICLCYFVACVLFVLVRFFNKDRSIQSIHLFLTHISEFKLRYGISNRTTTFKLHVLKSVYACIRHALPTPIIQWDYLITARRLSAFQLFSSLQYSPTFPVVMRSTVYTYV